MAGPGAPRHRPSLREDAKGGGFATDADDFFSKGRQRPETNRIIVLRDPCAMGDQLSSAADETDGEPTA